MGALIGVIILVLDVIAIVDAVKSSLSRNQKILWVILVLVLPVVGMILYFLMGRKK